MELLKLLFQKVYKWYVNLIEDAKLMQEKVSLFCHLLLYSYLTLTLSIGGIIFALNIYTSSLSFALLKNPFHFLCFLFVLSLASICGVSLLLFKKIKFLTLKKFDLIAPPCYLLKIKFIGKWALYTAFINCMIASSYILFYNGYELRGHSLNYYLIQGSLLFSLTQAVMLSILVYQKKYGFQFQRRRKTSDFYLSEERDESFNTNASKNLSYKDTFPIILMLGVFLLICNMVATPFIGGMGYGFFKLGEVIGNWFNPFLDHLQLELQQSGQAINGTLILLILGLALYIIVTFPIAYFTPLILIFSVFYGLLHYYQFRNYEIRYPESKKKILWFWLTWAFGHSAIHHMLVCLGTYFNLSYNSYLSLIHFFPQQMYFSILMAIVFYGLLKKEFLGFSIRKRKVPL